MAGFVAGFIAAAILLLGALAVYTLAQIADAYNKDIDRWFDGL